jgi:hypothetical protein
MIDSIRHPLPGQWFADACGALQTLTEEIKRKAVTFASLTSSTDLLK